MVLKLLISVIGLAFVSILHSTFTSAVVVFSKGFFFGKLGWSGQTNNCPAQSEDKLTVPCLLCVENLRYSNPW